MFHVADFVYFCFLIMQGKMMLCSHNSLTFTHFPPPPSVGQHICLTQSVSYFLFFALTAAISATFRRVCGRVTVSLFCSITDITNT